MSSYMTTLFKPYTTIINPMTQVMTSSSYKLHQEGPVVLIIFLLFNLKLGYLNNDVLSIELILRTVSKSSL